MRLMYITNNTFPSSTAHSARVSALCKAISLDSEIEVQIVATKPPGMVSEVLRSEFPVVHFGIAANGPLTNLFSMLFSWFFLLCALAFKRKPDVIIFTGAYARVSFAVFLYAKLFGVDKVIAEVCEWYEDGQVPFGKLGPIYWVNKWSRERFIKFSSGFVVISTLLEEFYKKFNKPVVRIPAVVDFEPCSAEFRENEVTKFAYAGHPGKNKDQIGAILKAYLGDATIYRSAQLVLIGITAANLDGILKKFQLHVPEGASIKVLGNVSQISARSIVKDCDFTVLLRNNSLNANAGFPTKVSESVSLGVPVISNQTSDIFLYMEHLVTAIKVNGTSSSALVSAMRIGLDMTPAERKTMKENSVVLARHAFFWKSHSKALQNLVLSI